MNRFHNSFGSFRAGLISGLILPEAGPVVQKIRKSPQRRTDRNLEIIQCKGE